MTSAGTRDGYTWRGHEGDMPTNPQIGKGRHLAITSPSGGILCTPRIETAEELRPTLFSGGCCDGQYRFPEACVFDAPPALTPYAKKTCS